MRVLRGGTTMNRADLLYSCLRDGNQWTRRDIYEHTGEFFLTNNAASELRKVLRPRGLTVLHTRQGRQDVYWIGSLREREESSLDSGDLEHPRVPSRSLSDSLTRCSASPVLPEPATTLRGTAGETATGVAEQLSFGMAA